MSSKPKHIIRRQVLEMSGVEEWDAQALQAEIGQVFQEQILPLLNQYLTAYSPNGHVHQIDRLELDVGRISRSSLGESFLPLVKKQLEAYFSSHAPEHPVQAEQEAPLHGKHRHVHMLRYFLSSGHLPWWADRSLKQPIEESVVFLFEQEPGLLAHEMRSWVKDAKALKRLVRHVPFSISIKLAANQLESPAEVLEGKLSDLMNLLHMIDPWYGGPNHRLQEILMQKLLVCLFQFQTGAQNELAFWEELMIHLAKAGKQSYPAFLSALYERANPLPASAPRNSLPGIIHQLWEAFTHTSAASHALDLVQWARNLLAHPLLDQDLEVELKQLIQGVEQRQEPVRTPEEIRLQLEEWASDLQERKQIFNRLTMLLAQASLSPGLRSRVQDGIRKMKQGLLPSSDMEELSRFLNQLEQSGLIEAMPEPDLFSEIDTHYVENGGLVILWPFLPRFFENLGLVKSRQFIDEAARHRAVALLQYLADGKEEVMEYRCGLNKLLCGLDWDVVLDVGEPISQEEAQECEQLLQAVIANAPILGEMSLQGFRGSFLLRKGRLSSVPGAWRLELEKEAYDIVLEKFPWSWNMVKLPWMVWGMEVKWG